ncbi:hypothetical protein WA026_001170 [Henosepilachna vigintioctopunctata]|uniref:Uncharacterized protein n=1 Tax=Henosepilachna vigintioctopunctata TaxID=420089 RepID=A0AAW1UJQ5_9CUCU
MTILISIDKIVSSKNMNNLKVVMKIPGFWMKIFEAMVALISSIYLSGHYVRYWIAREYHAFFISGSAGYFVISMVFIISYIQDRPNVLLEATLLFIMGIINLLFGMLACLSQIEADYEDEVHLIPLGILMILCGVVSLIDWLLQRFYGGWDRYYTPRRLPHRRRSIY